MSRLIFGGDLVYQTSTPGGAIFNAAADVVFVYRDAAGTTIETDLQTFPGAVVFTNGQLAVTSDTEIPLFYGPNTGVDTLYVVVNGGPITPIYARYNDRIEVNAAAIVSEAALARTNEAAAIATAETFATGVVGSETFRAMTAEATKATTTALTAEAVTARAAEGANATAITNEAITARAAELANATAVTNEAATARAAEGGISPTKGSDAWLKLYAANPDQIISGAITRDANDAATSAPVVWPDGTPGTYTADTVSATFPGAVDVYHVTYGSPATKTVTQSAVTRDATTGAVTNRPALTVA